MQQLSKNDFPIFNNCFNLSFQDLDIFKED